MRDGQADHIRDQQREAWRAAGPGWDDNRETLREANRPVTERMVALARFEPGQRVLDLAWEQRPRRHDRPARRA